MSEREIKMAFNDGWTMGLLKVGRPKKIDAAIAGYDAQVAGKDYRDALNEYLQQAQGAIE